MASYSIRTYSVATLIDLLYVYSIVICTLYDIALLA